MLLKRKCLQMNSTKIVNKSPQSLEPSSTTDKLVPASTLVELYLLISNDSYCMTFQTVGQYRTALLKYINNILNE